MKHLRYAMMGGFALVVLWLVVLSGLYIQKGQVNTNWKCNLVNCTKYITGPEWAQANCFLVGNLTACKVNVNGANQLIPLESLNLSAIQACSEYYCVEETNVRQVNYRLNVTV